MVKEANLRQAAATRALKESSMKVDVLSAEVAALKTLVLTSTPSHPNLSREDSISMPGINSALSSINKLISLMSA
jgi:Rab-3A-interacting protein